MSDAVRRLFIAVEPSDEARTWLAEYASELRAACDALGVRASFPKTGNLHVTIRFLGDTPESKVAGIVEALAPLRATDRFQIAFSGLGCFPNEKKSRVVWAGIGEGSDRLKTLAEQVDRCLQEVGIAPEERTFSAHLTLARFRKRREKGSRLMERVSPREGRSSLVQEVVLFQSDLESSGAIYTPRARIPLG